MYNEETRIQGIDTQWRNYNYSNNLYNNFRDIKRENFIFSNPTPRVGIIIRCPFSSVSYLKPIDTLDKSKQPKYIYLTVYQSASSLWGFPKGRWKSNKESYYQGALRELREETGIHLNMSFNKNKKLSIKRGKHHHYYFIIDLPTPPFVNIDNKEIIDYRWATLDWISSRNVSYFTENVLENLRAMEDETTEEFTN
jgi:8-oxo-dGTP pyrophosphatase MutT (NUDIX family)